MPDPRPYRDSLIAATAMVHGLTVVTRNTADFEAMRARVLNPWNKVGWHPWAIPIVAMALPRSGGDRRYHSMVT